MKNMKTMQIGEFAAKGGVTVRALRYYDRIGLLKPSMNKESGYRLYAYEDFFRLEQIVCLKYLGFPLEEIKRLLRSGDRLPESMALQKKLLRMKIEQLNSVIKAIESIENSASDNEFNWNYFINIIRSINMENSKDWAKNYYSEEQLEELGKRNYSPEQAARDAQRWDELFARLRSVMDCSPENEEVTSALEEYYSLIGEFTRGNEGIENSLNNLWGNIESAPDHLRHFYEKNADVFAFLARIAKKR